MITPRPTAGSRPIIENYRPETMSATAPVICVAPIRLRLRLAVSTLLVSWALAALFIVLGWRESRSATAETAPAVVHSESVRPVSQPVAQF